MKRAGFTLVELLLALALGLMLAGSLFSLLRRQSEFCRFLSSRVENLSIKQLTLERLRRELRCAESWRLTSSVEIAALVGTEEVTYLFNGGRVGRKERGTTGYLTVPGEIQNLSFSLSSPNLLKISIDDLVVEVGR
jgi:prepilin-type N-terminal cleavage/methylation domain-containing protein